VHLVLLDSPVRLGQRDLLGRLDRSEKLVEQEAEDSMDGLVLLGLQVIRLVYFISIT